MTISGGGGVGVHVLRRQGHPDTPHLRHREAGVPADGHPDLGEGQDRTSQTVYCLKGRSRYASSATDPLLIESRLTRLCDPATGCAASAATEWMVPGDKVAFL